MRNKPCATAATIGLLCAAMVSLPAEAGRRHGWQGQPGHRWAPGLFLGGLGIAIGLRALSGPDHLVLQSPPIVERGWPVAPHDPFASLAPAPIIYPSQGQSAAQTEADHQACNRWATTQPSAMADAGVFHRATLACMEGRGYAVR